MALSVNTSHPLYANLIELCVVDEGGVCRALVDGERTLTPSAQVTFGTGTYGRHFRSVYSNGHGVSIDPPIPVDQNEWSCFAVINDFYDASSSTSRFFHASTAAGQAPGLRVSKTGISATGFNSGAKATLDVVASPALSVCATNSVTDAVNEVYLDGVLAASQASAITSGATRFVDGICGRSTGAADRTGAEVVIFAYFNRRLTAQEIADLHASLGENQFALFDMGSAPSQAPANFTATAVSSTQINLAWDAVSGASGYDIEVDGGSATDVGNVTSHPVTGLTAETQYSFRVRAYNAAGDGPWTSAVQETTNAEEVDPPASAPTVTAQAVSPTQIDCSWTGVQDATGYEVDIDEGTPIDKGSGTTHSFTGLTPGTEYSIRARAYNAGGAGPWSTPALATTQLSPDIRFAWQGAATPTGFVVCAEALSETSLSIDVSTSEDYSSPAFTDTKAATSALPIKFNVTGLSAGTTYYWRVYSAAQTVEGVCKTFPAGAANLVIGFASCAGSGQTNGVSNSEIFAHMAARGLDLFLHMGDLHYRDAADATGFRLVLEQPNQALLYRRVPIAYSWDDHDYGGNNSGAGYSGRLTALAAYRNYVPHYPLLDADADTSIFQDFTIGRLRFIVPDCRSERGGGVILGTQQYDRLIAILDEVVLQKCGLVIFTGVPWISGSGTDTWFGAAAQRAAIAEAIDSRGLSGRVCFVAGDMHALAYDDGTNNTYAAAWSPGPPVFHAAAMHCPGSTKGGPYSGGVSSGSARFGVLEVTDTGGDTIGVTYKGIIYNGGGSETVWGSYSFDMNLYVPTRGVRVQLGAGAENLSGLLVRYWDDPEASGAPDYEADDLATDANRYIEIDLNAVTKHDLGGIGNLRVIKQGATPQDDFEAGGRVPIVDLDQ